MPLINFAGLASGIDSEALIDAIKESRRSLRVTPKEEEIAEIEAESSAIDELNTLMNELKTILLDFSDLAGGGVAKTVASSDETVISAIASNSADNGVYTLSSIDQLAENHTLSFNMLGGPITDTSANVITTAAQEGRMQITIGTGPEQTINIDVNDSMSWNELVAEINTSTDLATAQMVNVAAPSASPDYRLVITTSNVGTEKGLLSIDTTQQYNGSGGTDLSTYLTPDTINEDPALDAQFTMAGISGTITRSSNTINDIIPGVTLSLTDTSASAVTLQVTTDTAATESAVNTFIEKYNEIVTFIKENNEITQEQDGADIQNIFGPLASTRVDDGALSALRSALVGARYHVFDGAGTEAINTIQIFADLGITTERDGTLKFDSDKFQSALAEEPDSVNQILQNFANATAKSQKVIEQYTGFNLLFDTVEDGNTRRIEDLNDEIARAEESITNEENQIRARFARLESLISGLQN
ncbi:MAG: flagellar filament capping protein FliD, partial [Bdellovibrionales bacterium]|nr:flagellar filament capping protein FliD [Bdellovibrionales bacterium]